DERRQVTHEHCDHRLSGLGRDPGRLVERDLGLVGSVDAHDDRAGRVRCVSHHPLLESSLRTSSLSVRTGTTSSLSATPLVVTSSARRGPRTQVNRAPSANTPAPIKSADRMPLANASRAWPTSALPPSPRRSAATSAPVGASFAASAAS